MKTWGQYSYLELKRMLKRLPLILLGSLLLLFLLGGMFAIFQQNSKQNSKKTAARIGVAAAKDEPFIDWMITTISSIENTKYTCSFERMDEETANAQLQSGDIDIAFIVPSDYIASIIRGENKHLVIRFGKGQTTIVSFLFRELSHAASAFILDTEAGIYSMQEYYEYHNLPDKTEDELTLNLQYIKEIVSLDKGIRTQEIETADTSYPLSWQYLIAAFVLFLFLWGLTCSRMLTCQNRAFQNQLALQGVGYSKQILARGLSFLITAFVNYLLFFFLASLFMAVTSFSIPKTLCNTPTGLWKFALSGIPILLLTSAFIQFVYEITGDAMGGILFLFFSVLILGLCSGCFYPFSYLPQTLQKIAPALPVYQACRYGLSILNGSFSGRSFLYLIACSVLCYLLMILSRTMRQK